MTHTGIESIDTMKEEENEIFDETSVKQIGELLEIEGMSDMDSYEKLSRQHNQVCQQYH